MGDAYKIVTAAGSAVISDRPVTLKSVIVGNPVYDGTVEIYNAVATGTVAANLVYTVGTFPATALHQVLPLNISLSKGLSYWAAGTPKVIITYE